MTSKETSTLPLPPGSLGLPLLGETISFFTDRNFNSSRQAKYGKVYKTSIFGRPNVVMIGAEANSFLSCEWEDPQLRCWDENERNSLSVTGLHFRREIFI